MRIAYFIQSFQDFRKLPIGGVEQVLLKLQGYFLDRSHGVHIINCSAPKISLPSPDSLDIIHIWGTWTDFGSKIAKIYKGKIPIFVSPVYNDRTLMFREYIHWLESLGRDEEKKYIENFEKSFRKNILEVCELADYICVLGNSEKSQLIKLGVSQDAVFRFMTNGVDVELIEAVEKSWSIPSSQAIFWPARFETNKNQLRLIQAFKRFQEYAPQAQLWLAGANFDPEYKRYCERYAKEHMVGVHWLGLRPSLEVLYLMKAARVIAIPSISECLPLVALEAVAFGKPLVCTSNSYIAEYIPDWPVLCDPSDVSSIFEALRKAWLLPENRDQATRILTRFSWNQCAEGIRYFYEEALRKWLADA